MAEARFTAPERNTSSVSFNTNPLNPPDFSVEIRTLEHNKLKGRSDPDCHPISAITGLENQLETIENNISTEIIERQEADNSLQTQIDDISVLSNGYVHEQGIASAVWMVQHNLNKYPSVTVVDSAENEIVTEVEYLDKNSVKITMTGASKGRAYLN